MNSPLSFAPETFETESMSLSLFALSRVIPDDPDYRKYVPINYRLNAKEIVGEVAEDLRSGFWTELVHKGAEVVHWGLVGAEIAWETSILVAGLAIGGPLLAAVGVFTGLGASYLEAAEKIAANWSATGFSRGVVMGADRRQAKLVKEYFGSEYVPANPAFPRGRDIAMGNYSVGLLAGYSQGRFLSKNQREIFWRDLGRRMGDQSYRGPVAQWTERDWIDWYVSSAAVFRRDHL